MIANILDRSKMYKKITCESILLIKMYLVEMDLRKKLFLYE